jgi:hypothetical protein
VVLQHRRARDESKGCVDSLAIERELGEEVEVHRSPVAQPQCHRGATVQREAQQGRGLQSGQDSPLRWRQDLEVGA